MCVWLIKNPVASELWGNQLLVCSWSCFPFLHEHNHTDDLTAEDGCDRSSWSDLIHRPCFCIVTPCFVITRFPFIHALRLSSFKFLNNWNSQSVTSGSSWKVAMFQKFSRNVTSAEEKKKLISSLYTKAALNYPPGQSCLHALSICSNWAYSSYFGRQTWTYQNNISNRHNWETGTIKMWYNI